MVPPWAQPLCSTLAFPRVTKNHYLLSGGGAPLVLVMNRRKFENLPDAAKTIIRKYSGEQRCGTLD